jgi:hypothetical protein
MPSEGSSGLLRLYAKFDKVVEELKWIQELFSSFPKESSRKRRAYADTPLQSFEVNPQKL